MTSSARRRLKAAKKRKRKRKSPLKLKRTPVTKRTKAESDKNESSAEGSPVAERRKPMRSAINSVRSKKPTPGGSKSKTTKQSPGSKLKTTKPSLGSKLQTTPSSAGSKLKTEPLAGPKLEKINEIDNAQKLKKFTRNVVSAPPKSRLPKLPKVPNDAYKIIKMSDYDRQFEADLEKAQALSIESLALEQFRRQRQLSVTGLGVDTDGSGSVGHNRVEPPPALPPPPRRLSRPRVSKEPDISSGTSPTKDESSDLISFSSPTSKTPPKPHEVLKEYIDQINKIGQQTEELTISTPPEKMSNPYYTPPPPYPYPGVYYPPYPVPYGVPHPYPPAPYPPAPYSPAPYPPSPYTPYAHTRLSAPAPAPPVLPPYGPPPPLNYDMTNLVSRPVRPLYPQLSHLQLHTYPPPPRAPTPHRDSTKPTKETPRNSIQSNGSNRSSECVEAEDTLGSLPKSLNLIDFGKHPSGQGSVRVSVLEAFDPLLTEQSHNDYAVPSECSSSVYEEYDPLEFLYGETELRDTPIYATINKKDTKILPSPSPKSLPSVPAVAIRSTTNKLYDCISKTRSRNFDNEHRAYLNMVLDIRKKLVYSCSQTNPGFVIAARSGGRYPPNTTIKVMVHFERLNDPIIFTSDVESNVDHVIYTVICSIDEDAKQDMAEYMLRVWGANEYLLSGTLLSEYDYIRECVRLEKDLKLCLIEGKDTSLARTERDDAKHGHVNLDDLIPMHASAPTLTFDNLSIMLETLEGELSRAIGITSAEGTCSPNAVFQAVKAICALAGCIETLHITNTLNAFAQACTSQSQSRVPEIISDSGQYSSVNIRAATARETVALQCGRVRDAVRALVALYSRTRPVDFQLNDTQYLAPNNIAKAERSSSVCENTLVCVEAVHVGSETWSHEEYHVTGQLYHGTRPLSLPRPTHPARVDAAGFYPRIIYDTWITLEDVPINTLPREARLVLTLYGRTQKAEDNQHQNDTQQNDQPTENGTDVQYEQEELGWAAIQMFDYDGMLASGTYILPVWPTCVDKRLGPAPNLFHAPPFTHPLINIEIPLYAPTGVKWTSGIEHKEKISRSDLPSFDSLDGHTQSQLLHLIEQGAYQRMPTEGREVMWEKRQYLVDLPGALPLVLLAATHWYGEHRTQLLGLLHLWEPPSPLNAMHLLLPCFPEEAVRAYASRLIGDLECDLLILVLPQVVQALRYCTYETGSLSALLLRRALSSPPVAHALYWLLVHTLPHLPQAPGEEFLGINIEDGAPDRGLMEPNMVAWWRYQLLLRTLLHLVGDNLNHTLQGQQMLVKSLCDVAQSVKVAKEGVRMRALVAGTELLAAAVRDTPATLPLGLHRKVHDVDIKSCTFFSSNTLPLKINFIGCDNAVIPAMFKVGDDLRQDALVLQVMRVMDNLWLKAGLDLRMVTFQALPTNPRKGMIEIVTEAETLRAIQTEWGLTGSFKDKPIAEWLAKHNPSELEYQRARDNFTASCAGYSVATYLLGICDRHNDNIMLKTSGHLFHIDFGKFLGDAQMFGNFKRDRAPFVLTPDMVYVINGGERPTQRFQHFVELCCMAFNVVRAHHQHILDLFALMASSGVPGVSPAAVGYVRGALLPAASNAEAAAAFARLIHESLKSKFTPINFFLHNLAQLRASGDQGSSTSELLSFMPRTYTMSQEGRLVSVECLGYEKRYDPEKHYVYALRIYRQGQATPIVLYRSYKHFTELYQKICLHFPLAKVHSLPSGLHVGRSNVRQVAERRFGDVQAFLTSLFSLADEIAHSDLVYTFFHPLLRDQQEIEPQRNKHRVETAESENSGSGSLKLSVQYAGGVLSVLILHAQSLALTPQGLPPNPYVKVYLIPDPTKETKRKTRVLKRNSHPSFMEMLEYRLECEVVKNRSLQATVWNYDSLQENQFLGGVVIPLNSFNLREETVAWYPLQYIPR